MTLWNVNDTVYRLGVLFIKRLCEVVNSSIVRKEFVGLHIQWLCLVVIASTDILTYVCKYILVEMSNHRLLYNWTVHEPTYRRKALHNGPKIRIFVKLIPQHLLDISTCGFHC